MLLLARSKLALLISCMVLIERENGEILLTIMDTLNFIMIVVFLGKKENLFVPHAVKKPQTINI
jgi:hypothetical protein